MDKKKIGKIISKLAFFLGIAFTTTSLVAKKKRGQSLYEEQTNEKNPFEGKKVIFVLDEKQKMNADGIRGHLKVVGKSFKYTPSFYERCLKRKIDIILSFGGLIILSPVFLAIAIAIYIEDPGPVLFIQKRVGKNKQFFQLHKFRSMKVCTPRDVPTHMLDNPKQYITKVGRLIRKYSLDELPQIWDIFIGNMSIIGPRPALWNQDVLIAEREKYNANDVKPGLTGLAQINGRDELGIFEKAALDGKYVDQLCKGNLNGLFVDTKCFIDSIFSILKSQGVVEGGIKEMTERVG